MRTRLHHLKFKRLQRDIHGVTAVEFALVAPAFLVLLLGAFEFGQAIYIRGVLQGAVQDAGRDAGLESGVNTVDSIDTLVRQQVAAVAPRGSVLTTRKNYRGFLDVGKPEDFTDANANQAYDTGECFTDANGNGQWDADRSQSGQGGADDVVVYTATLSYKRIVPLYNFMGWSDTGSASATTVLRNQPYADQSVRPEVQICPT